MTVPPGDEEVVQDEIAAEAETQPSDGSGEAGGDNQEDLAAE